MIEWGGPGAVGGFREAIARGLVVLDAAMGTRLLAKGLRLEDDDPCLWNLSHPETVLAVHGSDVAAGAEVVLTNTFGANRPWLARFGPGWADPDRIAAINRAAVALARRAAGPGRFVVGDLGPTAVDGGAVVEQADLLIASGVDALIFETHRLDQAEAALGQLRASGRGLPPVPVLVSLVSWPDSPERAVARLIDLGAEALGGNCQNGLEAGLELAERLRVSTALPLIVKPAAGAPGGPVEEPEAFARHVPRLQALAPVLVGGCCGTSERHVAALRTAWYHGTHERSRAGK